VTIHTQTKDSAPVVLARGRYVKVAESRFPAGSEQHAMLYLNMKGKIKMGVEHGRKFRVKAVRRGTTDATAYGDFKIEPDDAEGNFSWLTTHTWFGGRPSNGYLDWYVWLGPNVLTAEANAGDSDYGKGMNN
jgi:hypothetical protein